MVPNSRQNISGEKAVPSALQTLTEEQENQPKDRAVLVALFRLLMREPPADHDCRTCPICKRHGIKDI
jgi:hypothetical protein